MKLTLEANVPGRLEPAKLDQFLDQTVDTLEEKTGMQWTVKMDGEVVRFASKASLLRPKTARGRGGYVIYDASPNGYKVLVFNAANEIIDEHSGGNSPVDSVQYDPQGVGMDQLLKWAKRTAIDLAAEYGIDTVEHDPDILEEEREAEGVNEGTLPPVSREL